MIRYIEALVLHWVPRAIDMSTVRCCGPDNSNRATSAGHPHPVLVLITLLPFPEMMGTPKTPSRRLLVLGR
ncbi:hypothetical protein BHE74_00010246 [Ensete ventricosum]|uniref:Uncharacterized protein n=1 Tax=Ensete ventricosum TaxID=4639 RepID=A0A444D1S0_ENSVE|nr:hypothetical protein B296_00004874 [Ensete ventricosum]RWV92051.1 hypothetical protein GW17_00045616 [Ensete ventricosum]RWW81376.1 hypothetical protein BHE74_00010246 [Ensete ventricosum]RZR70841.1 hypothetical protein BHM03_00001853 [Ensete ventricosum]